MLAVGERWLFEPWWSAPLSPPAEADSLFFALPKKSKQKKGAPRWRKPPWIFVAGRERRQTRCAQTASSLFPPRNKNPRRHLGRTSKDKSQTVEWSAMALWLVSGFALRLPCGQVPACGAQRKKANP